MRRAAGHRSRRPGPAKMIGASPCESVQSMPLPIARHDGEISLCFPSDPVLHAGCDKVGTRLSAIP